MENLPEDSDGSISLFWEKLEQLLHTLWQGIYEALSHLYRGGK